MFRLLGHVTVESAAGEVAAGGRRALAVLVALLLEHDRWVRTDALVDTVFGESVPPAARNSLQSHISRLRRRLSPHGVRVEARRGSYRIAPAASTLDVARFRSGARSGVEALAAGDPRDAGRLLRAALGWWRGAPLANLVDLPRMAAIATSLDEERRQATLALFDAELAAGHHAEIVPELLDATHRHPYEERLHGQLMMALQRTGRRAEALGTLRRLERTLGEELGITPGPELRELERRILVHSPLPPGPVAVPAAPGAHRGPPPAATTTAAIADGQLRFVGRRRELDHLARLARAASEGGSPVVVVDGEAGMGKSRLVREAVARNGGAALAGGCSPDLGVPYEPFTDILHTLAHVVDQPHLAGVLDRVAGDLGGLLPGSGLGEQAGATRPADPGVARYRMLTALHVVLQGAVGGAGMTVVVEDLHWAAPPTLAAVRFLALKRRLGGCLLVLTHRSPESCEPSPLTTLLADLRRAGVAETLTLGPLADEELAELAGAATTRPPVAGAVDRLRFLTGGLPLLAEIALRDGGLRDSGLCDADRAGEDALDPAGTVAAFVAERTARVDAGTHLVLARSAVLGPTVDTAVLDAMAGATDDGTTGPALDRLGRAGLLRELAADRFAFAHELTRAAVLAQLGPSRRARHHEEAAVAIERVHGVGPATADRLAAHRLAALRPGTELAAAIAARRAASLAMTRAELHDARRWATAGLELLAGLDAPAPADVEVDLVLVLADVAFAAGERWRSRDLVRRAAGLARAAGDARRLARAALIVGSAWTKGESNAETVAMLQEALAGLGDADDVLRIRLLAMLSGLATAAGLGAPAGVGSPRRLADDAVRLGRRALHAAGDPSHPDDPPARTGWAEAEALSLALIAQIYSRFGSPHLGHQLGAAEEIARLGRRFDDRILSTGAARFRAPLWLLAGNRAGFEHDAAMVEAFAAESDFSDTRALAHQWRSVLALLDGRLDDVEAPSQRAVDLAPADPNVRASHATRMLWLARERDGLDGAVDLLAATADNHPTLPGNRVHLALCAVDTGRMDLARVQLDRLGQDGFRSLPRDNVWVACVASLVEVAVALGDGGRAATLGQLLRPFTGQLAMVAPATLCTGAVDRYLGMVDALADRAGAAERHFAAALRLEEAVGSPPLQAWTHLWWGTLACRLGGRGRAHLETAAGIARRYGGAHVARRAGEALAARGP